MNPTFRGGASPRRDTRFTGPPGAHPFVRVSWSPLAGLLTRAHRDITAGLLGVPSADLAGLALIAPIRRNLGAERTPQRRRPLAEISEGVRWLWHQDLLRALVAIASAGNLAFTALGLTIIVRATDLGASSAAVGVLLGLFGVGAITGAQLATPVQRLVTPNVMSVPSSAAYPWKPPVRCGLSLPRRRGWPSPRWRRRRADRSGGPEAGNAHRQH
ncbi:hypothetical protein ACN27F_28080 [Solwaraspora sp. WMMB335]|uniref:hypothetical protein n=1 Tax=Solwaraspora sp. WMMB335 TaxID=3404118 RepID=UPI003B932FE1